MDIAEIAKLYDITKKKALSNPAAERDCDDFLKQRF
jgi:hypothetical protein